MNDFDKLKEVIKTCLARTPRNSAVNAHSVLAVLLKIADDVQSRSSNGWISADTPPDSDNDVWVVYKPIQKSHPNNKDRPICYCVGYYSYVLQRWFVADANKFPSCICEVTHWQPLLEPPREQQESKTMTQNIKPNDLVYIPTHSLKVLTVKLDTYPTLYATDDENVLVYFYPTGLGFSYEDDSSPQRPIVWLATPENKAKIEAFYDCQLEDIPVDE